MTNKLKVTTILGTRPEVIRLSEMIKKFDKVFNLRVVFTSQNRESFVGIDFFTELGLRPPNVILKNISSTTGEFLALLFVEIEKELVTNKPDLVVILGDTNTSLAAIIATKLGIPIYHIEAGNRSFDQNVPEEVNRKIVDHIADFNLTYSNHANVNLLHEGLDSRFSIVIGTPLREVIENNILKINQSRVLEFFGLENGKYFLVSSHRQENIDDPIRLASLVDSLNQIADKYRLPIIVSTHPRLKLMLGKKDFKFNSQIQLVEPLGFFDYCKLQLNSKVVLSDSGSISEECAILKFKGITLRDSLERPEALESGTIVMSGLRPSEVLSAIELIDSRIENPPPPNDYQITNTSDRVINFILSTHHVRNFWTGRRGECL